MKTKQSLAVAAMVLGLQIGAQATAQVPAQTISLSPEAMAYAETLIADQNVGGLLAFISANPAVLSVTGALGDALRAFAASPSVATLAAVNTAMIAAANVSVAQQTAPANTIY